MSLTQPSFSGAHDGLRPVRDLQLGVDVGDVVAHRLGAEVETGRNLRVAKTLGDKVEDLAFAVGERPEGQRGD